MPVAFTNVKFWSVVEPCTNRFPVVVAPPKIVRPVPCAPPPIVDEAIARMPCVKPTVVEVETP